MMKRSMTAIFLLFVLSIFFSLSTTAQSNPIEITPQGYFAVTFDVTEEWIDGDTPIIENPELMEIIDQHFIYVETLFNEKIIVLGGPSVDSFEVFMEESMINGGLIIYQTDDIETLENFIENDPIVTSGVFEVKEIRPFMAFLNGLKSAR